MSLIFRNLVMIKTLNPNHRIYNLYTKFVKTIEICKQFFKNIINESSNLQYVNYINNKSIGRINNN